MDGHGVVLSGDGLDHSVVRMDSVAAVRIHSAAPGRAQLTAGAHPMPGPRTPYE